VVALKCFQVWRQKINPTADGKHKDLESLCACKQKRCTSRAIRLGDFSPIGCLLILGVFKLKITVPTYLVARIFRHFFYGEIYLFINCTKMVYILGNFFTNSSSHNVDTRPTLTATFLQWSWLQKHFSGANVARNSWTNGPDKSMRAMQQRMMCKYVCIYMYW
jgi:hypothetical protein